MVQIVSRREAGLVDADPKRVVYTTWARRIGVAWHYSDGNKNSTPRDLQRYAMESLGYSDTHYNFFVDWRGIATEGRGWLVVGGHALNQNTPWIGICFIGREDDVTPEALATMHDLFYEAERLKGGSLRHLGHGELPGQNTNCPGSTIRSWNDNGMPRPVGAGSPEGDDVFCKKGDKSDKVIAMQVDLTNGGGYVGPADGDRNRPYDYCDGDYGSNTARGLSEFIGNPNDNGELYGPWQHAAVQQRLRNIAAKAAVDAAPPPALPTSVTLHLPSMSFTYVSPEQDVTVPLSAS